MILYKLIAIFAVIAFIIYKKLKKIYSFWEVRGIKGPTPIWLVGNVMPVLLKKESMNTLTKKIYDMYPDEVVIGIYLGIVPTLIVKDTNLIRKVLIKDFASFSDRGVKITEETLSDSIFFENGGKWRIYRQKLLPLFSTSNMKTNFMPSNLKYTDEFLDYIENLPPGPKELRELDRKLGVKIIMSNAFGIDVDTFKEEIGEFETMGLDILRVSLREIIGTMLHGYNNDLPTALGYKIVSPKLNKFVDLLINRNNKAKHDNPNKKETYLDFMNKVKEQGVIVKEKKDGVLKVDIGDSLGGHSVVFYGSGFEIFVNSSFLLFELALNQSIQDKCYNEISQVMKKYNGVLTHEAVEELQYLNAAFDESLRKYPSGGFLARKAIRDYRFDDINLTIEKGTKVIVPVQAIHHDPKFFPNPEVFEPERFLPENKNMIHDCTYLPFGDGPRKCIGYRVAKFESLLMLAQFLPRFRVTPCEKTQPNVRIVPNQFSLHAKDGLWVNITRRQ